MQKHWRITFYLMCILIVLPSVGYTGSFFKNYGKITPDSNAAKAFETYQINPNYNYYISGSDVYPHAIIGLDKTYKLEPDLWKQVEMTPKKIRELVTDMHNRVRSLSLRLSLHGFALFDDKGKQIGVWYSILETTTSLKMKDDHTVIIITPAIDTYLRYENR
ncbi:MAG: hypothetical protein NTX36_10340 [Proteobacteria bacterium]|nr:hypothetical protein [Pseudomonadota bacterium]